MLPTTKKHTRPSISKDLSKVINTHGGMHLWHTFSTVRFSVDDEKHVVDLHSRKTRITSKDFTIGFNGKKVWFQQKSASSFTSDPNFYYNLYFYFFAMPFVLADEGITYTEAKPLEYNGISFPGIKISYNQDVGASPDDNYFLYFHPETKQMEWLGYSVTYFSKKVSNNFNLIKYDTWQEEKGILLPKSISWFTKDSLGNPVSAKGNPVLFSTISLQENSLSDIFYEE
ncbi:DUF6503 family protein [Tenacibaculum sp. SG-28]|uniref:DUF6503 family protein n=1 Tax=Tenacibaculum sp. SG-28 TaxID=754426 RepID=UPI0011B0A506|nr:DUF6503 family protein [Tenacibaculum sp. SG-28]